MNSVFVTFQALQPICLVQMILWHMQRAACILQFIASIANLKKFYRDAVCSYNTHHQLSASTSFLCFE